jgi:hypothetical protein
MSILKQAALSAVAAVAMATTASAQVTTTATTWNSNGEICGGNTFVSCATVTATVSGNLLTLTVTNTGGSFNTTRFGAIGFIGATTGTIAGFTNPCPQGTDSCYSGDGTWTVDNDLSDLKVGNVSAKGGDESGGDGLFVGETVTFQFRLTSGTWDLTNAVFAVHEQGAPGECSNKMYINAAGENLNGNPGVVVPLPSDESITENCAAPDNPDPGTSVPEPATMGLLALGLVGMGGAGFLRRRRNK